MPAFANVTAGLALFIALGGTAVAATALERDAVGSPQIRAEAVRSSELRDEGIKIADVAPGAQTALRGEVRFAKAAGGDPAARCEDDLPACPDMLALPLRQAGDVRTVEDAPAHAWVIHAKLQVAVNNGVGFEGTTCGLVDARAGAVLDQAEVVTEPVESTLDQVTLQAVVQRGAGDPPLALRCTGDGSEVVVSHLRLTAQEAGAVSRP